LTAGNHVRPFGPPGDDHGFDAFRHAGQRHAHLLFDQPCLVVVHREAFRAGEHAPQVVPREHRQALAGIEHVGNAGGREVARVLEHPLAAVGRDDREGDAARLRDAVRVGIGHRARMEGRDLVVIHVGGDEGLGREVLRHALHVLPRQAEPVQAQLVGIGVVAHRGHDERILAQQAQAVGDVAGASPVLASQVRHQEGHVQDVDLVREDVVLELVAEDHDGVVRDAAADQDRHGYREEGRKERE
jgi:hypothetical protein